MSTISDYSKEEWILLHSVPAMIGAAVLAADESGIWGTAKESFALTTSWTKGVTQYPDNSLIKSLLTEKEDPAGDPIKDAYRNFKIEVKEQGLDQFASGVIESCGQAADLLDEKSDEQEAAEYKAWVLAIGRKVATAAKEKGSSGERISLKEENLLSQVAEALRA
jgi:hypothetical protein